MPPPHPPEFRQRAVELARQGGTPIAKIAKNLGISESCLRNWLHADAPDGNSGSTEKKELAELRRRNRLLDQENEILRRGGVFRPGERAPKVIHPLVHELAADGIPVAVACRVLKTSRSGYYDWATRPESARETENRQLAKMIKEIHEESRFSYESPRVTAELRLGLGLAVNRKRVERLMREHGIQGSCRRRGRKNLVNAATEEDLVKRQFTAGAPDVPWLTDITEHPTAGGKLYCAAVMDPSGRKIIGWPVAARQDTNLVIDALAMAVTRRQPDSNSTILHSDHRTQYTSWAFGKRLRDAGLPGSMGTVGDCYGNAMMESFWHTMQLELLDTRTWNSRDELANAIFEWTECWYNPYRRHSSLGMLSPADYERRRQEPPDPAG